MSKGMDRLLASASFDEVYQTNSPWFPSKSSSSVSTECLQESTSDEPRTERPAKRPRLSHDESKKPRVNNPMDLRADRDLDDPSYCAKSFLLLSTLASQEQDLLMPMAGIQLPDRIPKVGHEKCSEQSPSGNDKGNDDIDCATPTCLTCGLESDLNGIFGHVNTCAMSPGDVLDRNEDAGSASSDPPGHNIHVIEPIKTSDAALIRPAQITPVHVPDNDTDAKAGKRSPKITGDLERDLGLVNDDIGWL